MSLAIIEDEDCECEGTGLCPDCWGEGCEECDWAGDCPWCCEEAS